MSLDQSLFIAANPLRVVAFLDPTLVPASKIAEKIMVNPAGINGSYVLAQAPRESAQTW